MYVRFTVLVQKGKTDIMKVVHVTSEGYLLYFITYKYNCYVKYIMEDNTMFNKLFLNQNVFLMPQNITNPLMSLIQTAHGDHFDDLFNSFLDKDSIPYIHYIFNGGTESSRTKSKIS